ncbi:MAG: hypothetical protein CM1200mP2_18110 [Planctomycetaceae bacterium]|nr:MAG: hypothetical protein CM1200mP2_18110 [Planctomycetaceae bacterium]
MPVRQMSLTLRSLSTITMPLTDQVAIVTGGGRGIGLACVRALADDGASVVIATPEDAEVRSRGRTRSQWSCGVGTSTDVTSESDLAELVSATLDRFGRIDILVNNAGIIGPTAPCRMSPVTTGKR